MVEIDTFNNERDLSNVNKQLNCETNTCDVVIILSTATHGFQKDFF